MHPLTREVLERLWRSADAAAMRASSRAAKLKLNSKQFPGYAALPNLGEKERFHAELADAQRLGAIRLTWDKRAGVGGQIDLVVLESLPALADLLDMRPTADKVCDAKSALAHWHVRWPAAGWLLQAWERGRTPRGVSVDELTHVVDAFGLLDHCQEQQFADVSERRVSAQLFGDSKRIEALTTILDLLTAPEFDRTPPRHPEATLASLGLLKHPLPFLVAGPVQILTVLADGSTGQSPVLVPYSGYSPRHVVGGKGAPAYLLSVENLTIFHELANGHAGPLRGVVTYTGGFPSPSQLRAYRSLLTSLASDLPLWHWGDTDLGGFRIAGLLAEHSGKPLRLWNMATYTGAGTDRALSTHDVARIGALCERWGWAKEAAQVAEHAMRIEQELQALTLPG